MRKKFTLKAYTVLATTFLGVEKLNSQVTILGFDPDLRFVKWDDTFITHDTIEIDIDENGINDLIFTYDYGGLGAFLDIEIDDMVIGIGAEHDYPFDLWAYDIYAFHAGDTIDEFVHFKDDGQNIESAWISFTSGSGWNVYYQGNFNTYGYYLPLKLNIDDSLHYGWVRLSVGSLGNELYSSLWYTTDYSLVIYDLGYEEQPNTPIICQTNVPNENIDPILKNSTDADDFTEFTYYYHSAAFTDYSELRIFLIDNFDDAKNFSVAQAKSMDIVNYEIITGDTVLPYSDIYKYFDATTRTINGDGFDINKYYTAYFMKIPLDGDTSHLTLSAPSKIIKAIKQPCVISLDAEIIKVNNTGTAADFDVTFTKDIDESDIGEYKIGLISDPAESFNLNNLLLDGYSISVPKTEALSYIVNLNGIFHQVNGDTILSSQYYYPVISATGDGYNHDLSCYTISLDSAKTIIANNIFSSEIEIINFENILTIDINPILNLSDLQFTLISTSGEKLISAELFSQQTKFELSRFPSGIYLATIFQKNCPIKSLKIVIE